MKTLELTIPGRPVPWARPQNKKVWSPSNVCGGRFTATKQRKYREALASLINYAAVKNKGTTFKGPVYLQAVFIFGKEPGTWMRLIDIESMENMETTMPFELGDQFHTSRPNLDNLLKILMDAIEASGVLEIKEDCIISMVMAAKLKR